MKVLKIFHLIFVMMWVVGVATLAIISALTYYSGDELYTALRLSRIVDDVLVIPGATLTVLTAIVYGVWTNWGFFKHRWITVKWIISLTIVLLGTFYFSPHLDNSLYIADTTRDAALTNAEVTDGIRISLIGGIAQGSALVFLVVISVLKPWKAKKK
ncbi:hypothetical protein D0T66_09910 [Dysgonomonas sp. 25]|nr:hypothetical protein [Dysgonomonas sp. 25]